MLCAPRAVACVTAGTERSSARERRRGLGARRHGRPPTERREACGKTERSGASGVDKHDGAKHRRPKCPQGAPRDQTGVGGGASVPARRCGPGCQGPYAVRLFPRIRCAARSAAHEAGRGNSAGGAQHDGIAPQAPQPVHWPRRSRAALCPGLRAEVLFLGCWGWGCGECPTARMLAPVVKAVLARRWLEWGRGFVVLNTFGGWGVTVLVLYNYFVRSRS